MKGKKKFHLKFSANQQTLKGGRKKSSSFIRKKVAYKKIAYINNLIENIDQLVIVVSLKNPLFNSGLVDRFLVLAFLYNVKPILIITKIDLGSEAEINEALGVYHNVPVTCLAINNLALKNRDFFIDHIFRQRISAVVGHSGVGKTTLLNQIDTTFNEKVAEVSSFTSRGRHTTTRIRKHDFTFSGAVYDMPGLKEIDYINLAPSELKNYYPEFQKFKEKCFYKNCQHFHEPSCAIKEKLAEGVIHPIRYRNYINILNSL